MFVEVIALQGTFEVSASLLSHSRQARLDSFMESAVILRRSGDLGKQNVGKQNECGRGRSI